MNFLFLSNQKISNFYDCFYLSFFHFLKMFFFWEFHFSFFNSIYKSNMEFLIFNGNSIVQTSAGL